MPDAVTANPDAQVSHEENGRVLTGIGEPSAALIEHMDRRAPEPAKEPTAPGAASEAQTPAAGTDAASSEPPPTRGRQRFSDLTRERDEAKAERAKERTQRETLEREVTDLRARVQQAATPQQAAAAQTQLDAAQNRQADQAKPQGFQFPAFEAALEQFPQLTYDDWQDAKLVAFADWRDAQRDIPGMVQRAIHEDRSQRSLHETVESTRAKGRTAYKDFDAVLANGPGASVPLGMNQPSAQQRAAFIYQHPQSEHLQYAILKDGALAQQLQRLSDVEFGMAIARLAPNSNGHQQAAQPAVTPPAPYQPVGSGSPTQVTPSSELARKGFNFDTSGYREKRAAERKAKARY